MKETGKRKRRIAAAAGFLVLFLAVFGIGAACGRYTGTAGRGLFMAGGTAPAVTENAALSAEPAADDRALAKISSDTAGNTDVAADTGGGTGAEAFDGSNPAEAVDTSAIADDRKLIRTVYLSYETLAYDDFMAFWEKAAQDQGGYIESSSVYRDSGTGLRRADYTFRIPREKLDAFLASVAGQGTLTSRTESTEDVSLDYHDIEGRKKALETEYDTLMNLMASAQDVDTVIALNQRISEIRYQLDSYSSDLLRYDNRVNYATVSLSVTETDAESTTAETGTADRIRIGLINNLRAVVHALSEIAIACIVHLPAIAVIAAIMAGIVFLMRKIRHKKKRGGPDGGTPGKPGADVPKKPDAGATEDPPNPA